MDKHQLAQRLMATFLEELSDHVAALNDNLLALEKDPPQDLRSELLNDVFRSAHSLKGASRAVNVDLVHRACHRMEDILDAVRDERMQLSPDLFSLLFNATDALEEAGMRLREEQELSDAPLNELLPALERAAVGDKWEADEGHPAEVDEPATPTAAAAQVENEKVAETTVAAPARTSATAATVRVAADKLDTLLAQSGELLVARRRVEARSGDVAAVRENVADWRARWQRVEKPLRELLETGDGAAGRQTMSRQVTDLIRFAGDRFQQIEKDLTRLSTNMRGDSRMLRQTCDAIEEEVYHVRMLPFAEACGGLERVMRDVARGTGKKAELLVEGEDVEVDRAVLEGLKDPLIHLVRNAVDHGIETPEERESAGKDVVAKIKVSAELRGGHVSVVVADDGRGFDLERIREKVRARGLPEPADDRELARSVFLPGFSTTEFVTDVSGRGVGLDVVQSRIEALHGSVDVSFQSGTGTRFELTAPLTLTTIRCVLVVAAHQTLAVPTASVRHIVRFDSTNVGRVGGREMLLMGERPVPIGSLAQALGWQPSSPPSEGGKMLAVVVAVGDGEVALAVDQVLAEQEVLVKNLGARIRRVKHLSGATLLASGNVALVLNVPNLVRTALGRATQPIGIAAAAEKAAERKNRLLVVEDSLTTRTLMKTILESAGYEVSVAVDGQHALDVLAESSVDLVVSDVDMPRMNGFRLTTALRKSAEHGELPVILVTARSNDEDKAQGLHAGANAYIVKSSFDQTNLLETIDQLL